MKMESTTTPPGALTRSQNDSEDVAQPLPEFSAPQNTDIMNTRDDEASMEPPSDAKDISRLANQISTGSSSISIQSGTSTVKYSQEPFDHYRVRVKVLCQVLWPAESRVATFERRMSAVAKPRILGAAPVKILRRFLFPSSEREFIIERLTGGTYNRIVGITVKDAGISDPKPFILRAPRPQMADFGYIEREVAIVRYVRQHTTLPVADIIGFDATANNPLDSGYVLQSRLPGVSLNTVWDDLTHDQRCTVAQEIGKIFLELQGVTHSSPGIVEASLADGGSQKFSISPFDIKSPHDVEWRSKIPSRVTEEAIETSTRTPLDWFGTQFGRWLADELLANPAQILYWDYQIRFVEVAKQMDSLGILGDGQNCLCHFDLAARNVMVVISPNGSLSISGIVDWDSAAFAPKFVSCGPPSWLWANQNNDDVEESEENDTPSTPEQEQLKELFDDVVGFDWTWLAYEPEYRLARELFDFAQHGLPDSEAAKRADRFLKRWEALYHTLMNPKMMTRAEGALSAMMTFKTRLWVKAGRKGYPSESLSVSQKMRKLRSPCCKRNLSHRLAWCKFQGFRPNIKKPLISTNHKSATRMPTTKCSTLKLLL